MTNDTDATTRLLRIHGLVQGVGYRNALSTRAQQLGLAGWVRNRSDGTVEALVSGAAAAVEALVTWSRRGPPTARVVRVEAEPAPPAQGTGFHVVKTC